MKKPIFIALLLSCVAFSTSLFAATNSETIFYIEPKGGGGTASAKVNTEILGTLGSERASNFMGGANMGWRTDYIHILLAVDYNQLTFSTGNAGILSYGLGLAYEWNLPFITTIILKGGSIVNQDSKAATKDALFGGTISLGWFVTEGGWAKVSVDYTRLHQAGTITTGTGTAAITSDINIDVDMIGVSLSFPMDINYPSEWWRIGLKR